MALRVSCATPVAGPIGGLLGVGLASAAAGQAAIKCQQYLKDGRCGGAAVCLRQDAHWMCAMPWVQRKWLPPSGSGDRACCRCPALRRSPLAQPWKGVRSEDLLMDALLGVALFKARWARWACVGAAAAGVGIVEGVTACAAAPPPGRPKSTPRPPCRPPPAGHGRALPLGDALGPGQAGGDRAGECARRQRPVRDRLRQGGADAHVPQARCCGGGCWWRDSWRQRDSKGMQCGGLRVSRALQQAHATRTAAAAPPGAGTAATTAARGGASPSATTCRPPSAPRGARFCCCAKRSASSRGPTRCLPCTLTLLPTTPTNLPIER